MNRFLFFLAVIFAPIIFSWWLFVPMALLMVFLIKLPYEIILVGFVLDLLYYFGDGFWAKHIFLIFSLVLILIAFVLNQKIHWRRYI